MGSSPTFPTRLKKDIIVDIDKLRDILRKDIVTVTFTKKNGDKRVMVCTLIPDYLPEVNGNPDKAPNDKVVTVWDMEKAAWRSFRFDTVTNVETEYQNYVV